MKSRFDSVVGYHATLTRCYVISGGPEIEPQSNQIFFGFFLVEAISDNYS